MPASWKSPRRIIGWALIVLSAAPLHRLLNATRAGPAGVSTRASAEAAWNSGLLGSVIVVGLAVILARSGLTPSARALAAKAGTSLSAIPARLFSIAVGALAFVLGALVALKIHAGLPTSVDEMVQLLHAQALLSGSLTLPVQNAGEAWAVQNGLFTAQGWASIYPPMHTILLAGFLAIGVPWLLGPIALGIGTWAFAAGLEELADDTPSARVTGLLLAVCPFWLLLGSTHLSHATAAAGMALVFLCGVRLRRAGSTGWLLLGAAVGFTVCVRPWTGLALSAAVIPALVMTRSEDSEWRPKPAHAAAVVAGGVPFAALLLGWNATLFGAPLRLGYSAAFGPAHGLGFHVDPWGNTYGLMEALAYTGADLVQLSAHVLESPLPVLLLVAVALLAGVRLAGLAPLLAWALAGVAANALYWHHGVHMGPRMLFETTPAWLGIAVLGGIGLAREASPLPRWGSQVAVWVLVMGLLGAAILAPGVMLAQRSTGDAFGAASLSPPTPTAVVFVHGSWSSRISARLTSAGMRRDSIETALRRNDICAVDTYSRERAGEYAGATQLDLTLRAGSPEALVPQSLSPGNTVRVDPTRVPTPSCRREARSDRFGAIELETLLWRWPPVPDAEVVLARDMGPAGNARVLQQYPLPAYIYMEGEAGPQLVDYSAGITAIWGGPAILNEGAEAP